MLKTLITLAVTMFAVSAFAAEAPVTEEQKTLYSIGQSVSRSLAIFSLTPGEFEQVLHGLLDAQSGKPALVDSTQYTARIQEMAVARRKVLGEKQAVLGKEYLEKAAKEKGAVRTASGLVYIPMLEGSGESPKSTDIVKVNYRGLLIDGKEFDNSYKREKPMELKLDTVFKCWTEGVQKMKPGGKARLVCPPQLAYGDNGAGERVLPGATVIFDVDLLEVKPVAVPKQPNVAPVTPDTSVKPVPGSK